jgi:hypothetical protein
MSTYWRQCESEQHHRDELQTLSLTSIRLPARRARDTPPQRYLRPNNINTAAMMPVAARTWFHAARLSDLDAAMTPTSARALGAQTGDHSVGRPRAVPEQRLSGRGRLRRRAGQEAYLDRMLDVLLIAVLRVWSAATETPRHGGTLSRIRWWVRR